VKWEGIKQKLLSYPTFPFLLPLHLLHFTKEIHTYEFGEVADFFLFGYARPFVPISPKISNPNSITDVIEQAAEAGVESIAADSMSRGPV
jgi:hypothetical protein